MSSRAVRVAAMASAAALREGAVLKGPAKAGPDEAAACRGLFPKSNRPTRPVNDREVTVVEG